MSVSYGQIHNMSTKMDPYGTGDLQVIFGTSNSSMSWYFQSAPTNMWSKCKPFISSTIYSDRYTASNSSRLAGLAAAGYGLSAPTSTNPASIYNSMWSYNKPNGSSSQPWRALDFDEYCSNATPPTNQLGNISTSIDSYVNLESALRTGFSVGGLTYDELGIGDWYLCVVLSTTSDFTGTLKIKTSASGQYIRYRPGGDVYLQLTSSDLTTLRNGGYGYYFMCARNSLQSSLANYSNSGSIYYRALPSYPSVIGGTITISSTPVPPTPSYEVDYNLDATTNLNINNIEIYASATNNGYLTSWDSRSFLYSPGEGAYSIESLEFQTTATTFYLGVVTDANASLTVSYGTYTAAGVGTIKNVAVPSSYINSSRTLNVTIR